MRFVIIFLIIIGLYANGKIDIYKQEVNSLINYTLKTPSHIYDVFIEKEKKVKKLVKKRKSKIFKVKFNSDIKLIAILNNKILLKINKENKWVKVGDKIGDYKVIKILNKNSIIVLDNKKMKILSLNNKNNFKIKVR